LAHTKPITTQVLESLERNPSCAFDTLVANCSEFTWNQLFYEVDRLSRLGQLCLSSVGGGHYSLRLPQIEECHDTDTVQGESPTSPSHSSSFPQNQSSENSTQPPLMGDRHIRTTHRAYQLYEEQGRQDGHALEHWFQAEREIQSLDTQASHEGDTL
jgi:hypothetical protein